MKCFRPFFLVLILSLSLMTAAHGAELSDVPEDAPYADAVYWAAEQDLISGFEDGSFRPRSACTRAQAAGILWRAAGEPTPTLEANPFRDVFPTMQNYTAILWAAEKGIALGCTGDTFAPDDLCTNAQFLTFLWRAEGRPAALAGGGETGAKNGAYYADALAWAESIGILEQAAQVADVPATRADIASYLHLNSMPRMMEDIPLAAAGQLMISQQPQSMSAAGGMVTFTVQATGGKAPYSYQWESRTGSGDWFRVYDTTSNTLTKFPASSMITSGLYFRCVVTDASGSKVTSEAAKVLEPGESYSGGSAGATPAVSSGPLTIKTQPKDAVMTTDSADITFAVEVTGGKAPYTYRWESKSVYLDWGHVYDSPSISTLTTFVDIVNVLQEFRYRCVITDAEGKQITSKEAGIDYRGDNANFGPLKINRQPINISCEAGTTVALTIGAIGGADPYTYKWEYRTKGGSWKKLTEGALKYVVDFETTQALLSNDLEVRCTITDADRTKVTSDIIRISQTDTPKDGTLEIRKQPESVSGSWYSQGENVLFSVEVSGGTAPYRYHWQAFSDQEDENDYIGFYDIEEVPGGWTTGHTSPQLSVPFNEELIAGNFRFCCYIIDAKGNAVVTKPVGFVDAYTGPRVFEQPGLSIYNPKYSGDIVTGTTTTQFTPVVVGGIAPYTYQWQYAPRNALGEDDKLNPIDFGAAESSWASGFDTDTLTVLVYAPFSYEADRYYMSPSYRCKITAADGQFIYTDWGSSIVYDYKG